MEYPSSRADAASTKRSQLHGRVAGASIACVVALLFSAPARADVTLGQTSTSAGSNSCTPGFDYLQPSVTAGANLYTAREAGTITSWSTYSTALGSPSYTFKIFRRTSDPDKFQVISHAAPASIHAGTNTVAANLHVDSGDMIGWNETGSPNSCTFSAPGDSVLRAAGNLADGSQGTFSAQNDVRLNLSAQLAPSNSFNFAGITHNRRNGTATLTVDLSNPGTATLAGKGIKKRRASKSIAVAGPVTFAVAPAATTAKRLNRKGAAPVQLTLTFIPPGGDPNSQQITVKLKKRKSTATTG